MSDQTSVYIRRAIAEMAETPEARELLWDDPTPEQEIDILARAWQLAPVGTYYLTWGTAVYTRP